VSQVPLDDTRRAPKARSACLPPSLLCLSGPRAPRSGRERRPAGARRPASRRTLRVRKQGRDGPPLAVPLRVGRRSHAAGSSTPLRTAPRSGASRRGAFEVAAGYVPGRCLTWVWTRSAGGPRLLPTLRWYHRRENAMFPPMGTRGREKAPGQARIGEPVSALFGRCLPPA
jgi:hypothetical protein